MSTSTLSPERLPSPGLDQFIATDPGRCGGKPHLAGHRIKVQDVAVWHQRLGQSAEEIAATYGLSLAAVHAALAYYHAHRAEIDADLRADEDFVTNLRAASGLSPLHRKLPDRHAQDNPLPPG